MTIMHEWFRTLFNRRPCTTATDVEVCHELDTSTWPVAEVQQPREGSKDEYLKTITTNDEHLDIKVGRGQKARRFRVHKHLICRHSEYFRRVSQPGSMFRESVHGVFDLHQDNPNAFLLLLDWLYGWNDDIPETKPDGPHDSEAWKLYVVETCVLADKLLAEEFAKFALSQVKRYAHLFDIYDMELIYEETLEDSPLRRFAARWIRWRCQQQPHLWESSRNMSLQHDRRICNSSASIDTDPRHFKVEHWYSPCATSGSLCEHLVMMNHPESMIFETNRKAEAKNNLQREWAKRDTYSRRTQAKIAIPAALIGYSSVLVTIGWSILALALLALIVGLSVRFCHCAPCHCHGCSAGYQWRCAHHFYFGGCSTGKCTCLGGFPFCCCVWCCCPQGYAAGCCGCRCCC